MIAYVDTSALVPLLVQEPTSQVCGELWDGADSIVVTRLVYVEAVAALAMAQRMDRITVEHAERGRSVLDELWTMVDVIELDDALMTQAATMAVVHGLRGYDATHCAAAVAAHDDDDLVAASGDSRLLDAWRAEGLAVLDTAGGGR